MRCRRETGIDTGGEDVAKPPSHTENDIEGGRFECIANAIAFQFHERNEFADPATNSELTAKGEVWRKIVESGDLAPERFREIDRSLTDAARDVQDRSAPGNTAEHRGRNQECTTAGGLVVSLRCERSGHSIDGADWRYPDLRYVCHEGCSCGV